MSFGNNNNSILSLASNSPRISSGSNANINNPYNLNNNNPILIIDSSDDDEIINNAFGQDEEILLFNRFNSNQTVNLAATENIVLSQHSNNHNISVHIIANPDTNANLDSENNNNQDQDRDGDGDNDDDDADDDYVEFNNRAKIPRLHSNPDIKFSKETANNANSNAQEEEVDNQKLK